jgi:hypothetical protein
VVEFIHTATLLHDDVVDESDLRRGRRTANAVWGNAASVLVGDFLYSRSFQLMVELDRMEVMRILADTTNQIAEGEVLQLLHVRNPDTDEAAYLRVIERKTAVLFAAATRLGALLAGADARPAMRCTTTACNWAMPSRSPTTCSTTPPTPTRSARTSATTSPKARRRCRSSTRSRTAMPRRSARCARAIEHGDVEAMPRWSPRSARRAASITAAGARWNSPMRRSGARRIFRRMRAWMPCAGWRATRSRATADRPASRSGRNIGVAKRSAKNTRIMRSLRRVASSL